MARQEEHRRSSFVCVCVGGGGWRIELIAEKLYSLFLVDVFSSKNGETKVARLRERWWLRNQEKMGKNGRKRVVLWNQGEDSKGVKDDERSFYSAEGNGNGRKKGVLRRRCRTEIEGRPFHVISYLSDVVILQFFLNAESTFINLQIVSKERNTYPNVQNKLSTSLTRENTGARITIAIIRLISVSSKIILQVL
ncbi:hypothetical protein NE237_029233 [Protea cynaroides]|uniref:Uncharacterized protein n=1 Tax=Protea cynaroides TaxID=273540 RepID=A0A9Q0GQS8_9MAGN|nr:hypothetical protein NE237_029233 [Protea cynaroides]